MSDGNEDPRTLKLRELRAKRAAMVRAREEAQEQRESERALEDEQRAIADEEALAKAIEEHGEVGRVIEALHTDLGLIIIKRCSAIRWRKFQDADNFTNEAFTSLVTPCVIYPTAARFDEMLEEQPAILARASNAVAKLAGIRAAEIAKK